MQWLLKSSPPASRLQRQIQRMEAVQGEGSPPPLDPTLAPVLLFDCGADNDDDDARLVYSIPTRRSLLARGVSRLVDDVNWVTPHGWVLTLDTATRGVSLRDPFTSREVSLPRDQESLLAGGSDETMCAMSTHCPTDPSCVVVVTHLTDPVLCYCRPGGSRWFRHVHRAEEIDGHDDPDGVIRAMGWRLTAAAAGKFYAYLFTPNSDDTVATLEFSPDLTLTTTRVVSRPFPTGCCLMKFCVLESCGDLFMVSFCYTRPCDARISRVEVHKLDWSKNAWVKAAGLGVNRVFFIRRGQFGASMAADELGLKENCVYFTMTDDKGLYVHDTDQGTTSVHDPGLNVPDSVEPILLMPVSP